MKQPRVEILGVALELRGQGNSGRDARPFAGPTGIPEDRLAILRTSFMKTMEGAEFWRDGNNGHQDFPMFGERVKELVERQLASDPKILERVARLLTGK